jgi:adenosine deaminase
MPSSFSIATEYDLHLHLSGSVSKELLLEFAEEDEDKETLLTLPTDKSGGFLGLARTRANISTS